MNRLKKLAILAAVIVTAILLSTICYSQGDRPVKVDTSDQDRNAQPTGQHNIGGLTPAPKAPEASRAKPPVRPVARPAAPAPVQRVRSARPQIVREKVYHTRTIRRDHRGHKAVYQEIKRWNPASVSYVNARIAKATGKGNPQGKIGRASCKERVFE